MFSAPHTAIVKRMVQTFNLGYDNGTSAFTPGATLIGTTSHATATVLDTGNVDSGTLVIFDIVGAFQDNEVIIDNALSYNEPEIPPYNDPDLLYNGPFPGHIVPLYDEIVDDWVPREGPIPGYNRPSYDDIIAKDDLLYNGSFPGYDMPQYHEFLFEEDIPFVGPIPGYNRPSYEDIIYKDELLYNDPFPGYNIPLYNKPDLLFDGSTPEYIVSIDEPLEGPIPGHAVVNGTVSETLDAYGQPSKTSITSSIPCRFFNTVVLDPMSGKVVYSEDNLGVMYGPETNLLLGDTLTSTDAGYAFTFTASGVKPSTALGILHHYTANLTRVS